MTAVIKTSTTVLNIQSDLKLYKILVKLAVKYGGGIGPWYGRGQKKKLQK
jgi:hypothetical protein